MHKNTRPHRKKRNGGGCYTQKAESKELLWNRQCMWSSRFLDFCGRSGRSGGRGGSVVRGGERREAGGGRGREQYILSLNRTMRANVRMDVHHHLPGDKMVGDEIILSLAKRGRSPSIPKRPPPPPNHHY